MEAEKCAKIAKEASVSKDASQYVYVFTWQKRCFLGAFILKFLYVFFFGGVFFEKRLLLDRNVTVSPNTFFGFLMPSFFMPYTGNCHTAGGLHSAGRL